MIQPIMKDPIFLSQKSVPATLDDLQIAQDLLETLEAHKEGCVGMAANMIGQSKRIIIFDNNGIPTVMFNPEIIEKDGVYPAEESCLSLPGARPCLRYQTIKVKFENMAFMPMVMTFEGWPAQIIQHEIDHCNGILI